MALLIPVERTYSLCSIRSAPSTKRWLPKGEPSTESALCGSKTNLRSTGPFRPVGSVFVRRRLSRKPFPGPVRGPRPCESRLLYNATVEDSIAVENTTEAGQSSEPTIAQEPAPTIAQEPAPASPPVGKTERFKPRVPGQKVRREDPAVPAEALVEGAVFTGKVTTIQPFGAFVNFGAFTDGLVHISKLSTSYVKTVSDIVTVGQEVKVTILNVEESSGRIALSMIDKESKEAKEAATRTVEAGDRSRLQQGSDGRPINRGRIAGGGRQSKRDEQQKTPTRFSKGQEVEGTVKNKMRSGAFVDLGNNEEGFLRFTEIPGGENMAPDNALQTGEKIKATVLRIERGKVLLTMKPVVDIMSVNRSINTGDDSGAANPFEIAFRAFNLVPKQETSPVSEDVIDDESAVAEADLAAEDPVPAAEEKEVSSDVAAGLGQAPSAQEDLLPEVDEGAVAQAALATEESAPDLQEEVIPEAFPAPEGSAPAIEREIPEVAVGFPAADVPEASEGLEAPPVANATDEVVSQATSTAVDEEIAAEPTPSEDVVIQSGIAEESPAADKETAQLDVPEVAAASEAAREVEEVIPEAVEAVDDILSAEDSASETEAALEELIVKDEVVVGTAPIVTENSVPDVAVRDIPAEAATEEPIVKDEVVLETASIVTENPTPDVATRDIPAEAAMELIVKDEVVVGFAPVVTENAMPDVAVGDIPAEESEAEPPPLIDDAIPKVADASTEAIPALEEVIPETTAAVNGSVSNVGDVVAEAAASMVEFPVPEAEDTIEPSAASEETVPESVFVVKDEVMPDAAVAVEGTASAVEEVNAGAPAAIEDSPVALVEEAPTAAEEIMAAAGIEDSPTVVVEEAPTAAEVIMAAAAEATVEEKQEEKMPEPMSASEDITPSVAAAIIEEKQGEKLREPTPESEVITAAAAAATVEEKQQEKKSAPISAALVKQLRDETGAGMMDCKKALAASGGDIETARETLRKRGLASAEKRASRIASEGLIGSYVHDSRIGVLVEVNCETDFVSRGPAFKSLVEDVGMQVVASQQVQYVSVDDIPAEYANKEKEAEAQREDLSSKPEAIRGRIVDGRVEKRLNELTLLEQPYIRDDKVLVKDLVKQTVATLGENIKVRRFERYVLGEGLQKKSTDFAAEVAAQTATKAPVEAPKTEETPEPAPDATSTVAVSASLVKELRDQTGAGMMDCKKALKVTDNNLEKATEFLRKKGLASADKKSSRLASEGLIGTYIHDGRIGILIEVNCETDFVARGEKFKELVDDLAMQAAAYPQVQVVSVDDIPAEVVAKEKEMEAGKDDLANKPEAIRARIVDGRVAKRLAELSLEEQPYIRNDKKMVKDVVKETVASLGENIQIRRFTRFNLGEGIEKKVIDFAAEVAAQTTGV